MPGSNGVSDLELNTAIVKTNTRFVYPIVNQTPRVSITDSNLQEIGVFSTSKIDETAPRWKDDPDAWTVWKPDGASNAVFIERDTVKALESLASQFLLQTRWHPETEVANIASFGAYDIKHRQLLQPWHASEPFCGFEH